MNWLSFLLGVTASWVFMGIFLLLLDVFRKPTHTSEDKLLDYWAKSEVIGLEKVRVLTLIAEALIK